MTPDKCDDRRQEFEGTASVLLANPDNSAEVSAALINVISQSIADGILKARGGLGSELVSWNLAALSGQLGGFTQVCEVKATLFAKSGPP